MMQGITNSKCLCGHALMLGSKRRLTEGHDVRDDGLLLLAQGKQI